MKRFFNRSTGLSVYGAAILMGVLTLAAVIVGLAVPLTGEIDPETSADYKYYEKLSNVNAFTKGRFFHFKCASCHKDAGRGPLVFGEHGKDRYLKVISEKRCSGYTFNKNRCALCHENREELFMEQEMDEDTWNAITEGEEKHPEVTAFYEAEIPPDALEKMKITLDFRKRWNNAQWFAVIAAVASILGMAAFLAVGYFRTRREKQEPRYLT